jgi:HD domain
VAAVARDPDVFHAAAAPGRFPGRLADARRPARLRLTWPQLVPERAASRLVLEQRNGHLTDHAVTSRDASIIIVAGSEPSPGGVGPGAVIRTGCADRGGGGQGKPAWVWATAAHVSRRLARGVAARARSLAPVLGADADLLEAAARLHDIGYAPGRRDRTARTRRRPLPTRRPGRRHHAVPAGRTPLLRRYRSRRTRTRRRPRPRVRACAGRAFQRADSCDMTTSPDGEPVPVDQRLAEIHHRYGPVTS